MKKEKPEQNSESSNGFLTDEQCDDFRRLPFSFDEMVRAIHKAGYDLGYKESQTKNE